MVPSGFLDSIVVLLVVSAVQLAVGGAIGWLLGRGRKSAAPPAENQPSPAESPVAASDTPSAAPVPQLDTDHTQRLLAQLGELAASVAQDVHQHSTDVQAFGSEISSLPAGEGAGADGLLMNAVAKMMKENERLQGQLVSATTKIEEQKQEMQTYIADARTDLLTGRANRRALDEELARRFAQWQRQRTPLAVLMADVDHFKKFNDQFGHQAGDEVLRGIGRTLARAVADTDLVARYGGEEFAVVMPGIDEHTARRTAARVRAALAESTFRYGGTELKVTASLGLALLTDQDDPASLVKRADEAMYVSKGAGRNCAHLHTPSGCQRISEELPAVQRPKVPAPGESPAKGTPAAAPQAVEPPSPWAKALADLPSRRTFMDDLGRHVAQWRREGTVVSTMLIEVDHLNQLRHRLGPKAADLALWTTAQFLRAAVREMDLVSRYGDATFAVLLPGTDLAGAALVAERLRTAIDACRTLQFENTPLRITVSVGLTESLHADDETILLQRAAAALHSAQDAGGNACRALPMRSSSAPQHATAAAAE